MTFPRKEIEKMIETIVVASDSRFHTPPLNKALDIIEEMWNEMAEQVQSTHAASPPQRVLESEAKIRELAE